MLTLRTLGLLMLALSACKDDSSVQPDDSELPVGNNDEDNDGYPSEEDCDDNDPLVNPGQTETCDGRDNDCDELTDEDVTISFYADGDEDGFGNDDDKVGACERPEGYTPNGGDCDDVDALTYPGAVERCDEKDNDCDGVIDDDASGLGDWYGDSDSDGYGDPAVHSIECARPEGYVGDSSDCDDSVAGINPGADELCNGLDDDCDGDTDEDEAIDASTWYADGDNDAYGDPDDSRASCEQPSGYVTDSSDCDDRDSTAYPGATEVCDGNDNDCDGTTDEPDAADAATWYADTDSDAYGNASSTTLACDQPSGFVADDSDCDDTRSSVNPGADEYCNTLDDDCDGKTDEADAVDAATWYADGDTDTYGDPSLTKDSCTQPTGYVSNDDDCDDSKAAVNPAATELCNTLDDDCDGTVDEPDAADAPTWYADTDSDSYGDAKTTQRACTSPSGYVSNDDDCDDTRATVSPADLEYCNTLDDDCDGTIDEADAVDASVWYTDADGDTYGDPLSGSPACTSPSGTVSNNEDCDDDEALANPGLTEICGDRIDNDCDGTANGCGLSGDIDLSLSDAFLNGEASGDSAGFMVAGAGDVNLDGYDEVLVGSLYNDRGGSNSGAGYLVNGPVTGTLGLASANAIFVGENSNDYAGYALDGAGDFNGDGTPDVLIGAWGGDGAASDAGAAYVLHGPLSGTIDLSAANLIMLGEVTLDYAGIAVAGAGDNNGDGYDDVLIGAWSSDKGGTGSGAVYLVNGPLTGTISLASSTAILVGEDADDSAGYAVAGGKDFNGDGLSDLLLGANRGEISDKDAGVSYVINGPVTGTVDLSAATALIVGEDASDRSGLSVAALGDVDADGYDDVLIGAYLADAGGGATSGAAYLVYGPVSGVFDLSYADAVCYGAATTDQAGYAVADAGDSDGDGFSDLLIGAPQSDAGGSNSGAAYLIYGPILGSVALSSPDARFIGENASDAAGFSVAGAGDVDGINGGDLLVGARLADRSAGNAGTAYLLLGGGL